MAVIRNLDRLIRNLRTKAARALKDTNVQVTVGYTQSYAIFVHENLNAHHEVGQAKFLEQPARELTESGELTLIIYNAWRQGKTMAEALILAGLRLQRDSQELCPVKTGALKASAFTRLDGPTYGPFLPPPGGQNV
jgi:hypothetical protein